MFGTENGDEEQGKIQKKRDLDILRGIGICGIFLYHLSPHWFCGGFLGVPLFFVLSGYLMFLNGEKNLWQEGKFYVRRYYAKRFRKIFPPLFAMIMVICAYLTVTQSSYLAGIRQEVCSIFFGYNNWWQIGQNASYFAKMANVSPFTHLWFLAVEIQFYIFLPFIFFIYKKGCDLAGNRRMCFFFLALALLSAGRMCYLYIPGADPSRVYYGTDTMAFSLFLGMFLGALRIGYPKLCVFRHGGFWESIPVYGIFVPAVSILFVSVDGRMPFLYQGGMFLLSLLFVGLICLLENKETKQELPHMRLLALLGRKSYGIYLWHYPIIILTLM